MKVTKTVQVSTIDLIVPIFLTIVVAMIVFIIAKAVRDWKRRDVKR